jgi:5-methylthioadenosine/S-adenosylhomocysteine deaminase
MTPPPERADLVVRNADIVAFDGTAHRLLAGGALAVADGKIVHVGRSYDGQAARTIDARGGLLIPGMISTHAHVGAHEGARLLVDSGRREFVRSGFLHFLPGRRSGGPGFLARQNARASLRYGFATLARHGVTTVLAFAPAGGDGGEAMLAAASEMGVRLIWAPLVAGGRYWIDADGKVERELDEKAGLTALERAVAFVEARRGSGDGMYAGAITLDEFHVSTPGLRKACHAAAKSLGVPFTLHFVEQLREFFDTMQATGRTPVQLLADEGVLDRSTLLAHCIYHAGHSLVGYPMEDYIGLIGRSGAAIAHSPVAFSRRGVAFESFDRFRRAGARVALATDAYPLDLLAEMRMASIMCKTVERNHEAAPARAVFEASNLVGADVLGRPDLGRIAVGAAADFVVVDTRNLSFGANPDPIRALVHLATPDMIDTVVVAGRPIVEGKRLIAADPDEIFAEMRASSEAVWESFPASDYRGRHAAEAFPPSLEPWKGGA